MIDYHFGIAVFVARVFLGILFFIQGYDKIFRIGLPGVIRTFKDQLINTSLGGPVVALAAYFTSYIELIGGLCLIIGFMKYMALYALGIDLILVAVALGAIDPLWKMDFVFPRLALLLLLLLLPPTFDFLSLDYYLFTIR